MAKLEGSQRAHSRLAVELAASPEAVIEAQRLRYRVFAEEMGAVVHGHSPGCESDAYDAFCQHLLVRERDTARVVACSRILDAATAAQAGGFYSACEFEMERVAALPGRIMELGRTCVDAEFRNGATIATLWSGLARHIVEHGYDYLFGCASISLRDGGLQAAAIMHRLRGRFMADAACRVAPRLALPAVHADTAVLPKMPPLLKAYLSLGARICGEPCWDPDFGVADVFILVDTSALSARYVRHFMGHEQASLRRAASA